VTASSGSKKIWGPEWNRFFGLVERTVELAREIGRDIADAEPVVCAYCLFPVASTQEAEWAYWGHADHIVPKSRGGSNHPDNLTPACPRCNLTKGARTPGEWLVAEFEGSGPDVHPRLPGLAIMALREMYDGMDPLPPRSDPARLRAQDAPNPDAVRKIFANLPPAGTTEPPAEVIGRFLNLLQMEPDS
jgi:hypothetical protein